MLIFQEWRQRKEEEATKEAQQMKEQQYLDEIKRLETQCMQLDSENAELKTKIQAESGVKRLEEKKDVEINLMRELNKQMAKNRISSPKYVRQPTKILDPNLFLCLEISPRRWTTSRRWKLKEVRFMIN